MYIQKGKKKPSLCAVQNGTNDGSSKSGNETIVQIFKNKRKQPFKENAGIGCCEQKDLNDDIYIVREKRILQSGESLWKC